MIQGLSRLNVLNRRGCTPCTHVYGSEMLKPKPLEKGFVFSLSLGNRVQERKGKTCQILKAFPYKLRAIFSFLM